MGSSLANLTQHHFSIVLQLDGGSGHTQQRQRLFLAAFVLSGVKGSVLQPPSFPPSLPKAPGGFSERAVRKCDISAHAWLFPPQASCWEAQKASPISEAKGSLGSPTGSGIGAAGCDRAPARFPGGPGAAHQEPSDPKARSAQTPCAQLPIGPTHPGPHQPWMDAHARNPYSLKPQHQDPEHPEPQDPKHTDPKYPDPQDPEHPNSEHTDPQHSDPQHPD